MGWVSHTKGGSMPRFPRFSVYALAAASLTALAGCATQQGFQPIAVTRSASAVASCEKVADLEAKPSTFDQSDAELQLQREAREKGANTVLVSDAEGTKGVAYRCSQPAVTSPSGSGSR